MTTLKAKSPRALNSTEHYPIKIDWPVEIAFQVVIRFAAPRVNSPRIGGALRLASLVRRAKSVCFRKGGRERRADAIPR